MSESWRGLDEAGVDELMRRVKRRFESEGRWVEMSLLRDEMFREAKKSEGLSTLEARAWAYSELDRLYPPVETLAERRAKEKEAKEAEKEAEKEAARAAKEEEAAERGRVKGLGRVPKSWGKLPANSSLAVDLAWVQANRLEVVTELPSGATEVHLDRAEEPAPSRAALGWLETSIRSYAKYVDIVGKSLAGVGEEREVVRKEKVRIEEMRTLLGEMRDDE